MFTKRYLWFGMVIILLLVVIPACGGDDDNDETISATSQVATSTPPPTTTTSGEPVKIGVLTAWSGGGGISGLFYSDPITKLVEKQVEDMGGILGGRPVKFVPCDTAGVTTEALRCAEQMVDEEKVSVLSFGGIGGNEASVIADVAKEKKVLFASVIPIGDEQVAENQYVVVCSISSKSVIRDFTKICTEILIPKPQTCGVLTWADEETRAWIDVWKQNIEAAGIELVYEDYISHDVTDFSPYLTKIKYEDPETLVINLGNEQFMAIAKQIMDLGGWDNIQVIAPVTALIAVNMQGTEGWIVLTPWNISLDDPESVKFRDDFEAMNHKEPMDMHVYIYTTLWTAIHAIELAGTDNPADVARAARSGNLEFDTPMGRAHFGTDGLSDLGFMYVQVQEGGVLVPYPLSDN